uniref:Extended synaptotagmin-like protein 1b n=1 Tax=Cyprinodon variegatus TaxID=28743 RepID=A0A3Q2DLX3_CYPVA
WDFKDTGPDRSGAEENALSNLRAAEASKPKGISAVAVLWTFGKCLSALLPVYLAGYYRVSTSLLVCGMMVYTGWKHAREAKEERLKSAIQLLDNEEEHTWKRASTIKRDLPAWVNFPDVEKVEWLNKVLQQVWPFVGQYLEKLLIETIAPSIRASSAHLQTLNFTKVDMGDKPMKVVGIKAHTENDKGQVLLDLYISYVGNVEINVEVKRYFCKAGVKGIQLHGMMRVILEPLIGDVPIVGAVTMFFIRRPKLDINWTGLTNLLDIPGLNVMSDSMIMDAIASFLVLPNRLVVPLVPGLHVAQLRCPLPRGVVRIHLLEAQNLAAKDNYVKGVMAGLSDPYAILRVGPQTFTSKHIDNTDSPKWGEMYEVIVHEVPGQELEVEVYDKDTDKDDFLGRTKLDLGIVKRSIAVDDWFTLKETTSGRVHFKLEWLALQPNTEQLEQVLKRNESVTSKNSHPPSSAILVVYLDKAEALPMKKGNKEPNPMVQVSVQGTTKDSKICYTTINPEWEEAFTFFIQDPRTQEINIQVKDADRVQTLGKVTIPLSHVLKTSHLSLDQWFQLEDSGTASRIYINSVLRVLWLDEDRISAEVSSNLAAGVSKQLPMQASPHPSFATEVLKYNGLLRIHLLAGQNLIPKDNLMGGMVKGKSDPYVKINIGGETFTSQVIKGNLNPTWNEMYEVILTELAGQELHVEMFDKDMDMKDDFMGRVHMVLEWVPTSSEPDGLDQVLQFHSRQSYQNKAVPSAGLLFVYVEQADGLPVKKSGKDPKVGVELSLREMSRKTTVCDRTTSPKWNEAFYFPVRDPRQDILILKLSHSWTLPIGSLIVPIRELLSEPDLVLDQWFHLDGASPESQILLRTELKVGSSKLKFFTSVETPPVETIVPTLPLDEEVHKVKETALEEDQEEELESPTVSLPPHSSPDLTFASEGLLRLILLEAQSLVAKDTIMGGLKKGKSDPYAKISIGQATFKSAVVKENLNPVWNEMYEVVLRPQPGQVVQVELFDKDMDNDDFLGRWLMYELINNVCKSIFLSQWYSLNDVKSGRLRLILEWVPTVSSNDRLEQVMQLQSLQPYQNKTVPSAALLFVYMDRAHLLPNNVFIPSPYHLLSLLYCRQVCDRSRSPQWSEAFHFQVHDPNEEMLIVKLSSAWDQPMGSLVLPVRQLLSEPQLLLDQWMPLDGALPESKILLRAELKVGQHLHAQIISFQLTTETLTVSEEEIIHTLCALNNEQFKLYTVVKIRHLVKYYIPIVLLMTDFYVHCVFSSPVVSVHPAHPEAKHDTSHSPGVLRIHLLEAKNLIAKDNLMGGMVKGKSDPYVKINIGENSFKSQVIKENLNPTWNEMYEVVVNGRSNQDIKFEAFDKDIDSDDFLGRFTVQLNEVIRSQYTDQWFTLKDVKSGQIHLILEWVPTVSNSARVEQVLQLQTLQSYQNKAVPSAALLSVYLEGAHSLPLKKSGKEPKAGVELVLGETTYKTKLCDRSTDPQWNESFYFLVHDPKRQMLVAKLSSGWDEPIGALVITLKNLLAAPQLVLDQWFPLDGALPESQILLRAELKILNSKMVDMIDSGTLPCTAPAPGNGQVKLSLSYSSKERKLVVIVHACRGLVSPSKDSVDSYVSIMLLPDKSKATKKKTAVRKKDLNPEYNERFEYDLREDEARFRRLSVSVKNNSASFRSPDVIGQVSVRLHPYTALSVLSPYIYGNQKTTIQAM